MNKKLHPKELYLVLYVPQEPLNLKNYKKKKNLQKTIIYPVKFYLDIASCLREVRQQRFCFSPLPSPSRNSGNKLTKVCVN